MVCLTLNTDNRVYTAFMLYAPDCKRKKHSLLYHIVERNFHSSVSFSGLCLHEHLTCLRHAYAWSKKCACTLFNAHSTNSIDCYTVSNEKEGQTI